MDRSWWARTGTTTLSPAKMFQRALTDIDNKMLCQGCQYRVTREMCAPGALTIAAEMKTRLTLPRLSGHPPFIHNNITESGRFRDWNYEDYNPAEESSLFRFTHLSFVDCEAGGFYSKMSLNLVFILYTVYMFVYKMALTFFQHHLHVLLPVFSQHSKR